MCSFLVNEVQYMMMHVCDRRTPRAMSNGGTSGTSTAARPSPSAAANNTIQHKVRAQNCLLSCYTCNRRTEVLRRRDRNDKNRNWKMGGRKEGK